MTPAANNSARPPMPAMIPPIFDPPDELLDESLLLVEVVLPSPERLPKSMLTFEPLVSGTPQRSSDVAVVLGAGFTLTL